MILTKVKKNQNLSYFCENVQILQIRNQNKKYSRKEQHPTSMFYY